MGPLYNDVSDFCARLEGKEMTLELFFFVQECKNKEKKIEKNLSLLKISDRCGHPHGSMCVYIYTCIYVYINVCMYVYIYIIYLCVCVSVCVCVCVPILEVPPYLPDFSEFSTFENF